MPKRKFNAEDNQVSIRRQDVPEYLKTGSYYRSLADDEDDDTIMVPKNVLKPDPIVKSISDANHLFESLRFWIVDEIPVSFLEFIFSQRKAIPSDHSFWRKFTPQFSWLENARMCVNGNIKNNLIRMEHMIRSGNMALVKAAHPLLKCMPPNACDIAVCKGVEFLQFIDEYGNGKHLSKTLCSSAVYYGKDEKLLAAAHALGFRWDNSTYNSAIYFDKLSSLKYLHEHGCQWDSDIAWDAVRMNRPECLKYVLEHGCYKDKEICETAAAHGYLQCLQYAHEADCPWGELVCTIAANHGHLSCLQYAHEHGCRWSELTVCNQAASGGHITCLEYLHTQGCPWDSNTFAAAARQGHLHCLQYLMEHGCPFDSKAYTEAARGGHLKIMQFLQKHGVMAGDDACTAAASAGSISCLRFLHEHGYAWDTMTCTAAAGIGDLKCLQYAHEHGCPWDDSTCTAAVRASSLDCLEYAYEEGCPITSNTLKVAGYMPNTPWAMSCYDYILDNCTVAESSTEGSQEEDDVNASDQED